MGDDLICALVKVQVCYQTSDGLLLCVTDVPDYRGNFHRFVTSDQSVRRGRLGAVFSPLPIIIEDARFPLIYVGLDQWQRYEKSHPSLQFLYPDVVGADQVAQAGWRSLMEDQFVWFRTADIAKARLDVIRRMPMAYTKRN